MLVLRSASSRCKDRLRWRDARHLRSLSALKSGYSSQRTKPNADSGELDFATWKIWSEEMKDERAPQRITLWAASEESQQSRAILQAKRKTSEVEARVRKRLETGLTDPVSLLRDIQSTMEADLPSTVACLNARLTQFQEKSPSLCRAAMKEETLGTEALAWLCKNDQDWLAAFAVDVEAQLVLSLFLVAEGRTDVLESLLVVELPRHCITLLDEVSVHRWRGAFFRNIVRAHLLLGEDNADEVIACFFRIHKRLQYLNRNVPRGKYGVAKVPVGTRAATIEINNQLAKGALPRTSAKLLDHFVEYQVTMKDLSESEREFNVSNMLLSHPAKPDCRQAIRLLRTQLEGRSTAEMLEQTPSAFSARTL